MQNANTERKSATVPEKRPYSYALQCRIRKLWPNGFSIFEAADKCYYDHEPGNCTCIRRTIWEPTYK